MVIATDYPFINILAMNEETQTLIVRGSSPYIKLMSKSTSCDLKEESVTSSANDFSGS